MQSSDISAWFTVGTQYLLFILFAWKHILLFWFTGEINFEKTTTCISKRRHWSILSHEVEKENTAGWAWSFLMQFWRKKCNTPYIGAHKTVKQWEPAVPPGCCRKADSYFLVLQFLLKRPGACVWSCVLGGAQKHQELSQRCISKQCTPLPTFQVLVGSAPLWVLVSSRTAFVQKLVPP